MATKTFKIGLSNTDKQNMAQDVYERLEALLFAEYDSTETYHQGDYVVYNDALYKCTAESTTGTWDAADWESATLQDLVDDVSGAVASVNGKANIIDLENGTLVVAKALTAQELEPVSEESGDTQEEPFIIQGTGTLNNTASVDTGSVAKQIEKQGNTIGYNQLSSGDTSVETASNGNRNFSTHNLLNGHKYLLMFDLENDANSVNIAFGGISQSYTYDIKVNSVIASTTKGKKYYLYTAVANTDWRSISLFNQTGAAITTSNIVFIDLTQWFNGDIPQDLLDNPDHFSWYYNGDLSYNAGDLVDSDGQTLTTTGRNQWDEEVKNGLIQYDKTQSNFGQDISGTNIVSKNYIAVIPNTTYYGKSSDNLIVFCYDKDKNPIIVGANGYISVSTIRTFTVPSDCYYIRFYCPTTYGTTYNHDITISLYYTTGDGYDQYYPYEAPKTYDTGTETLRSTGYGENAVKDSKEPDGTITRRVGTYTFTGDESWGQYGNYYYLDTSSWQNKPASGGKCICNSVVYATSTEVSTNGNGIRIDGSGNILVGNNDKSKIVVGTVLFYELATPTTESGTPFAENIEINDYGTMSWDSDVPQGVKIFYPAWYVGFIDSLGQRADVDWDASNIVSQTQLGASETQRDSADTQLKEALGGTLRQCLCVKESLDFNNTAWVDLGTLEWALVSNQFVVRATQMISNKIICTKYKTAQSDTMNSGEIRNKVGNYYNLVVQDSNYDNITAFKNAMKGVLLAYEKA